MGAGKSLAARAVARLTDRVFVDLDAVIEDRLGMSIPEIFATRGEAEFRRAESSELERATSRSNLVVATGGGAFSKSENRRLIRESGGVSIFLDPPWTVIRDRLEGEVEDRPMWVDPDRARSLYDARLADYREASFGLSLGGEESPEEIAGLIESALLETVCVS